jgi:glycosyltransferase involved in cell wall biosynthesis
MLLKNRIWDYMASNRVDIPLAASNHVSKRIEKYYRRNDFKVIYPSVEIDKFLNFKTEIKKEDYYITIAALTQWKRLDVLIKAFNKMPEKKLKIV